MLVGVSQVLSEAFVELAESTGIGFGTDPSDGVPHEVCCPIGRAAEEGSVGGSCGDRREVGAGVGVRIRDALPVPDHGRQMLLGLGEREHLVGGVGGLGPRLDRPFDVAGSPSMMSELSEAAGELGTCRRRVRDQLRGQLVGEGTVVFPALGGQDVVGEDLAEQLMGEAERSCVDGEQVLVEGDPNVFANLRH